MIHKNYLYFAYHYMSTKQQDATIKFMIRICFISILMATCCLALVISIMNGFEQATYQKMQSIYPDIIIDTHDEEADIQEFIDSIQQTDKNFVKFATQKHGQALVVAPDCFQDPSMLMIKGIIPEQEVTVSNIEEKITQPTHNATLQNLLHDNSIIIGQALAEQLQVQIDDAIYLLCCKNMRWDCSMKFHKHLVRVAGIFKTGIDELDSSMAFCHQNFFDSLFKNHPINEIHLRLLHKHQEANYLQHLQDDLHCDAYSWKDLYPALVAALKLEKWAMIFILGLIILLASMNITSLINMFIIQKKRDIAILLCFGMSQGNIKKIFMAMSVSIAWCASFLGLSTAWIVGVMLQKYPFIKLPDNMYDTDYLPIQLELLHFCTIFVLTIFMSLMASFIATRNTQHLKIVTTLKNQ